MRPCQVPLAISWFAERSEMDVGSVELRIRGHGNDPIRQLIRHTSHAPVCHTTSTRHAGKEVL